MERQVTAILFFLLLVGLIAGGIKCVASSGNVKLPRYPSINPQGTEIVFSWRGDLWKIPSSGGTAVRLTTHPGNELASAWSDDGEKIAFESDRSGFMNIYLMNADGTGIKQITDIDRGCSLTGFGVDGKSNEVILFSAVLEGDLYRSPRPYMISINGGDILRVHDAFGSHPVVSPNGNEVAFTRGGSSWSRRHYRGSDDRDIWLFGQSENTFTQLTQWTGNDGKAKWGSDDSLYFLSDREFKCVNLYRMKVGDSDENPERLTSFKENDIQDFDIAADGHKAVFLVWDTLYTLQLDTPGGKPVDLSIHASEDESFNYELKTINREISEAALSPDGKVMAFITYGEVYVRNIEEKSPTLRVTHSHAREKEISWSPDGLKLYFVSDEAGTDSIYSATVALTRNEVKDEYEAIVHPDKREKEESEEKTEDDTEDEEIEEEKDNNDDEEEDKEEEGDKDEEKEEEEELPKELDPKRWHDAVQFVITPVVVTEHNDRMPQPSPDGKYLSFRRGRGDLMLLNLETGDIQNLFSGWDFSIQWRWSPDSQYIAYHQNDRNFNSDIWIVPIDQSEAPVNISQHPDNDTTPRWSADGKILSFISERVNEEFDVWMVYLDKKLEGLTPKELADYYEDAAKAAKKRKPLKTSETQDEDDDSGDEEKKDEETESLLDQELELELDDAYLRLQRVTTLNGNEYNNEITPAGDRLIFTGKSGKSGLFSIKWDGSDLKRLTDSVDVQHVDLKGEKVVFVTKGRAGSVNPDGGDAEYVDIEDKIQIDLQKQASQKFFEAARILGEIFYHPTMKGLDWDGLTEKYHSLVLNTRTADEFNYVAMRLMGELNGSHLGIYASDDLPSIAESQGRLGTIHERVTEGFKVIDIVPESPADKEPMSLQAGDIITAIENKSFAPADTVESFLEGRIGKETLITIQRELDNDEKKELNVLVTPISWGAERQLKYKDWRLTKVRLVEEWSGGRVGYIHIQAMNQSSLDVFERDLYAAAGDKDGLIIDVRNNGGGWTTDRVLASIMVQPHAYTVPRGADPNMKTGYPQDRLFIQRYSLPINMLCNEKSFSNAEIISHAFKTLERGTLVGQETHGAVISTGGTQLIDGTYVRLPFRGWYVLDGTDMENHGAVPDIIIPQTPEAESENKDEQLKAAVVDLMERLP